eukprot:TRINITY_DN18855_c0_g1_i1.p1 TRINITY_DN18855_c0_g1~~TRINITY_DN18855_c0_g1_i1.p1  ORF type:complete len:359 (-),score=61.80 TRINITY_DN18855_c0_g1_i1:12-1088(-)
MPLEVMGSTVRSPGGFSCASGAGSQRAASAEGRRRGGGPVAYAAPPEGPLSARGSSRRSARNHGGPKPRTPRSINAGSHGDEEGDDHTQQHWEDRYKFFSSRHMKHAYRIFKHARHDPFNKDPAWGMDVISRVARACASQGKSPQELFEGVDITGDGDLNRPEMNRVVCSVLPDLSEEELTAIFDTIDEDKSGEVSVSEFIDTLAKGQSMTEAEVRATAEASKRWRNPLHRITRMAPARIEGWDHLDGPTEFDYSTRTCDTQQRRIADRLSRILGRTPRGRGAPPPESDRYARRSRENRSGTESMRSSILEIEDLVPKPGWMVEIAVKNGSPGSTALRLGGRKNLSALGKSRTPRVPA